ncbi:DUF1848 family protein [Desulfospira joergensenii]|uniref:DUF1848 family protein n=1 Tax=Desulfospira joergensenii TaxID=53329 RepID=UPI0003B3BD8E|nr:DUF1848 family protein [Desulfospira joergensenii]
MGRTGDQIISASRRTDIPGGYTDWFMDRIQKGGFRIKNPYNQKERFVSVTPDNTHSIVFWSKNYGPFLDREADRILTDLGYPLFFNFTINSQSTVLEPGIPPLGERLSQLARLSGRFGPDRIAWRFDPICFFKKDDGRMENNLKDFPIIADAAADLGIPKCVTSFYDAYAKVKRRVNQMISRGKPKITFHDPGQEEKIKILERMAAFLGSRKIRLSLCCESGLFREISEKQENVPDQKESPGPFMEENACIDGPLLKRIYKGNPLLARDYGQRSKLGCRCTKSIDIGSYEDHPCFHDCLFCYANTGMDTRTKKTGSNENKKFEN